MQGSLEKETLVSMGLPAKTKKKYLSPCDVQRGLLYPGMHPGNHMLAMGKTGLLSHGLGGYSLSSAGPSGKAAALLLLNLHRLLG